MATAEKIQFSTPLPVTPPGSLNPSPSLLQSEQPVTAEDQTGKMNWEITKTYEVSVTREKSRKRSGDCGNSWSIIEDLERTGAQLHDAAGRPKDDNSVARELRDVEVYSSGADATIIEPLEMWEPLYMGEPEVFWPDPFPVTSLDEAFSDTSDDVSSEASSDLASERSSETEGSVVDQAGVAGGLPGLDPRNAHDFYDFFDPHYDIINRPASSSEAFTSSHSNVQ
ncbi:uncharacterized protein BP5553_10499 [Venustampulla echinocandica]|uniref:Uncharacterized protein n=1 Tax=Venustampulla echinocandica TaxID=2656787 RepID=A0A370T9G8_9HELO|nr:uncharacterized protein BP5553_10499 [Venustampulla echinocandica]RDL30221.1 hypothetical protein BP5553_10499 [Venustampulla echinocandica]